ncbi:MAG: hypothetical protein QHJ82_14325 [Verrucomicrobiota bacterium]|nr:hypothetical protein [Verrucomicrobiota bacterium]
MELGAILPQVMQQAGQLGFRRKPQRRGKLFRQGRNVAQVFGQRLPMCLWQRLAVRIFGCVRVVSHRVSPKPWGMIVPNELDSKQKAMAVHILVAV